MRFSWWHFCGSVSNVGVTQSLSFDDLTPMQKEELSEGALFFIEKNNDADSLEGQLAKLLDIESGVLIVISDKAMHINGLILLVGTTDEEQLIPDDQKREVTTLL